MRENMGLYRGKRKVDGKWAEGAYLHLNLGRDFICDGTVWIGTHEPVKVEVIPETVGQFTGLTDKNGKQIFEGDICTYPDGYVDHAGDGVETFSVGVVTWDNKHPHFYLSNNIGVEWDEIWDSVDEITVIGNIHDNPELLHPEPMISWDLTDQEKERRLQVIRSFCGGYAKGTCDGQCIGCLDRFLDGYQDKKEDME